MHSKNCTINANLYLLLLYYFKLIYRQKPPIPLESWAPEVFDASEHGDVCFSPKEFAISNSGQSEVSHYCYIGNIFFF